MTTQARLAATLVMVVGAATALLCAASAADATTRQSGIQLTPDSQLYLISKDVGDDRWAITYDLTHRTVTGNVFPQSGGPPQFVWCQITSVDQEPNPADAMYHLSCQFAQACASAPCTDQWSAPIEVAPLAGSFLLPTNTQSTLAGNVQPIFNEDCALSGCHADATAPDLDPGDSWGETVRVAAPQDPAKFYVDPFNDGGSYLLDKVLGTASSGGRMPLNSAALSAEEIDAIRNWILEGAADN